MPPFVASAALVIALAGGAPAPDALLGPMAAPLRNRVGHWCVEAQLRFTPQARPIRVEASADSRLLGERWLVTELRTMEGRGGFEGLGVNGYDPGLRRYTGYWIDSTRGLSIPVEGDYDTAAGVFRTRSTERGTQGDPVTVVSETRAVGPDEEIVRFVATDAQGVSFERMVLRYRRATADGGCGRSGAGTN